MKTILPLLAILLLTGCSGCTYTGVKTPLQPGESIIFRDAARANEFRTVSGNDATNAGRVVEINRPTVLVTE